MMNFKLQKLKILIFFLFFLVSVFFIFYFYNEPFFLDKKQPTTVYSFVKDFVFPLSDKNDFEIIRKIFISHEELNDFLLKDLKAKNKTEVFENFFAYKDNSNYMKDFKSLKTYYICYIFNDYCFKNNSLPYVVDILEFENKSCKMIKNTPFENNYQKEVLNAFVSSRTSNSGLKGWSQKISFNEFSDLSERPAIRIKKIRDLATNGKIT